MANLTFATLRRTNVDRCVEGWKHPLHNWSPEDWFVAASGEAGEALNLVKKLNRDRDGLVGNTREREQLVADLADEIADCAIYFDLFAARIARDPFERMDQRTFATLRAGSIAHASGRRPLTASEIGARLLARLGSIGWTLEDMSLPGGGQLRRIWFALDNLALFYGIDLADAIVGKFNATSDRLGFPHLLLSEQDC